MSEHKISISQDGQWAGDGTISDGRIECAAMLGPDGLDHESGEQQDEAERVYAAIELAIERGESRLELGGIRYTWDIESDAPTVSLRGLTALILSDERVVAPGSESYLWGEYVARMTELGLDAGAAYRDHDDAPQVPAAEAAWWLGASQRGVHRYLGAPEGRDTLPDRLSQDDLTGIGDALRGLCPDLDGIEWQVEAQEGYARSVGQEVE